MNAGEVVNAVRRALNGFDEWNDVAGVVPPNSSWYYEVQSVIEDAVHCGIQAALGVRTPLPSELDVQGEVGRDDKTRE